MALVVSEHEFKVFMGKQPFDTKWLGTQYKITGKKPLPIKTQLETDVVIIYSDTRIYMRGKDFFLEELFRNNKIGVLFDIGDEIAVKYPLSLTLQYELFKTKRLKNQVPTQEFEKWLDDYLE